MKVILTGYGKMGKLIRDMVEAEPGGEIVKVFDIDNSDEIRESSEKADVIIDFSNVSYIGDVIDFAKRTKTPLLSGTTGIDKDTLDKIKALGSEIPVIHSSNYSLGIAVFKHLLEEIAPTLEEWDKEVTETHHNQKADAPSGTAKILLEAIDPEDKYEKVYGREGMVGARKKEEIGVHALRGGTVAGIHTVGFYGVDEILEIKHTATSRAIFASGAVKTAKTLIGLEPGFYTMEDILF